MNGKNYIDGQFISPSLASNPQKVFVKYSPCTEEKLGIFPDTNPQLVNKVVDIAKNAQKEWRSLSRVKRSEYFDRLCEVIKSRAIDIIKTISDETGKTLNEATAEYNELLHMVQYTFAQGKEPYGKLVSSEIAEKESLVFRKPKGVIAIITAWNFPCAVPLWNSAPALLEGNTVIFKPSEDTPASGQLIAELYDQAGFPPGVFNLVQGYADTGRALVESDVNHISFTGSAEVGRIIRQHCATTWSKTCSCEMGSKSAVIVFSDSDFDMALQACVTSAFKLSGQRCVSASRILIERKIYKDFCEQFVQKCKTIKVGDPTEENVFYGPIINKNQLEKIQRYNKLASDRSDVIIHMEGKRLNRKGYFLTPHVYSCSWDKAHNKDDKYGNLTHPFLTEEVFGPHVALIPFEDAKEAVKIYNGTKYGLSFSVLTKDMTVARYMRDNCDYGLGYHNLPCIGAESHLNFGGVKASGLGGSSAAGSFKTFTDEVTWTINYDPKGFQMAQGLKA